MVMLIVTIVASIMPLLAIYMFAKMCILAYLAKDDFDWFDIVFPVIACLVLFLLWFGLYLRPERTEHTPNGALVMWAIGMGFSLLYSIFIVWVYSDLRAYCRKKSAKIKEASKMNEVKDWSGVQTRILGHVATYWFWMFMALPVIVLSWLGVSIIGIRVLKYANVELGAMIVFEGGKLSLAGFPLNMLFTVGIVGIGNVIAFKVYQWRKKEAC